MARGTIDQLNFEVILNDTKFDAQVRKDIALANQLNTSLTNSLNLRKKLVVEERSFAKAATQTATAQQRAQAAIERQAKGMTSSGLSLNRAWLRFSATMWSIVSIVRLFVRTIGQAIKNISEFQQANANLATIMQVSKQEIETLTNDALMLGRTTEWTASQVTELQTALAKLGYNIPQIQNMQASVLQFATAVGAKLPDAANLAGAALRMFGMHSSEMQKALEILTASTNKTALDFEKLKVALPYAGAIAHSIGFDIAQTSSLLGVLTNAGLASSRAGTGLRQVLLELSKQNGKLQTAMGGNIKTFDDFVRGLQLMRDRGLEAGEAAKLVSTRASSALLILANGVDDIKRLNEEVRDTDGLLKTIQAERLDTLHGSTLLLKSAWEGLIQTFRDSAGPMKDIVDWLTKIIRATSLAASRANRVAQGTKDVVGSDQLTKQFKEQYEGIIKNLVEEGMAPENAAKEAAKVVNEAMQKWRDEAFAANTHDGIDEKGWYKFLTKSIPVVKWITKGATRKWRARDEQVDAIDNAMGAMSDYMDNHITEQAEIAANEYLDQWRIVFDTKGADAARAAADSLIKSFSGDADMKKRLVAMRDSLEEYITGGGEGGARDRGKGPTALQIQNEAISDLKMQAQYVRHLADAYEKLEPYLGEGTNAKMVELFGAGNYSPENLEAQIMAIASALRALGNEGADAATALEQAWGLDKFSQVVKQLEKDKKVADDAQKAMEKYQETLRKWMGEDFNLEGTGFDYDINKIFTDYNTKVSTVQEKYLDAVEQAQEAHKGNAEAIAEETAKLAELRDAEIAYVRATAQEKINDLAESYLKDQYFMRGISMDHLGDMTLGQLRNLRKELTEISKDAQRLGIDLSGVTGFLASLGMDIETLTEEDLESLKDKLPETAIETIKFMKAMNDTGLSVEVLQEKIQSAIKKGFNNLDEQEKKAISKFAKYAANQILELADSLNELGEAMGNIRMQETAKSISVLGDFAKSVSQGFSQAGPFGAIVGAVASIGKTILADLTEQEREAAEAAEKMADAMRNYNAEMDRAAVAAQSSVLGTNQLGKVRVYVEQLRRYKKYIDDIFSFDLSSDAGRETWAIWNSYGAVDENGVPDLDKIKSLIDSGLWTGEDAKEMEAAIERYKDALKEVDGIIESVFGDIAANAADKIVNSWIEAGNAALDYADILDDVAKAYSKMLIQSMIMETALDPITEDLKKAFNENRYEDAMAMVANAMGAIEEAAPMYEQILRAFDPYFKRGDESAGSNSLGSGIKSITEDTANLLASYMNAIRADVSYIRSMYENGFEGVAELGASLPTLNDYLAQIAATNYDTAQNTQRILSELQSVIGAPGTSGMVVRVEAS